MEALVEENVNVGSVHGGASRALLILSLETPRSQRMGFDLIRLILWHYLDCIVIIHTAGDVDGYSCLQDCRGRC